MKSLFVLLFALTATFSAFSQKPNTPKTKLDTVQVKYTCPMHTEIVSDHAGICAKCKKELVVDRRGSKQVTASYTCSMHPDVASNEAGKCPVCNMDLSAVKTKPKKG